MLDTEKPRVVHGAYSWVFNASGEKSVFIGLPEEDVVKEERIPGQTDWMPLHMGMLAVISGKVEPGEDGSRTIQREAFEEQQLLLTLAAITNTFPEVELEQRAGGKLVAIRGDGYKVRISEEQLTHLQRLREGNVAVVEHGALAQFLADKKNSLRPFVYVAAQKILTSGLLYQG